MERVLERKEATRYDKFLSLQSTLMLVSYDDCTILQFIPNKLFVFLELLTSELNRSHYQGIPAKGFCTEREVQ